MVKGKKENLPEEKIRIEDLSIRYWTNVGGLGDIDDHKRGTVILFHGNAFSLDSWKKTKTLQDLSSKGYRVFAIDLPAGKGSMSDKLSPKVLKNDPNRMLNVLDKLFIALDVGAPFVIVGPSMGGGFALAYAISRPKNVSALVLVSPSVYRIGEEEKSKLSSLDLPILLIWGERDRVFPLEEYGRPLKEKLPNAKLLVVKGAGHGAYLDKPNEFNKLLLDFILKV